MVNNMTKSLHILHISRLNQLFSYFKDEIITEVIFQGLNRLFILKFNDQYLFFHFHIKKTFPLNVALIFLSCTSSHVLHNINYSLLTNHDLLINSIFLKNNYLVSINPKRHWQYAAYKLNKQYTAYIIFNIYFSIMMTISTQYLTSNIAHNYLLSVIKI